MKSFMNIYFYSILFLTSSVGLFYPEILLLVATVSLLGFIYTLGKIRDEKKSFTPQSSDFKELEKFKKRQVKVEDKKHSYIHDQIAYIGDVWGYSKAQEKVVENFLEQRAYGSMYNKLSASLLPQMILLIDRCIEQDKKGCKREVTTRLRELTDVMKDELKKKKSGTKEDFETTIEVYDYLIGELK